MLKTVRKAFAALTTLFLISTFTSPAYADDSGRYLDVTLLGDSYTAGNGAGSYYRPEKSYRSTRNWGHVYVNWLNEQGVQTTVRNLAASGAKTADVLNKQIPLLDSNSDLIMITVGGNDIKFEDIVKHCFVGLIRSYSGCEKAMNYARDNFPQARDNIRAVFEEIQRKVVDDARIILVGYPLLSIDTDYSIGNGWVWSDKYYPAAQKIREFGHYATAEQAKLVEEWNLNPDNTVKITFVPTELHFAGHEPDPEIGKANPQRWINEIFEDEGVVGENGTVTSIRKGLTEYYSWYHPNITGHQEIARLLTTNVGVPQNVRTVRSSARDVDIVFAVETTQATAESLADFKAHIRRIMKETAQSAQQGGHVVRFALLTYRDVTLTAPAEQPAENPAPTSENADKPTPATKPVTVLTPLADANLDSVLDDIAANGITAVTALRSAAESGIAQFNKPSARQVLMMMGDLAAQADPNGWDNVAKQAFSAQTAEVIGIDTNGDTSEEITTLARRTGGYTTNVKTIRPLIVPEPIASFTAPTLAKIGDTITFDASESYPETADVAAYEWDFNGDGTADYASEKTPETPATPQATHVWNGAYNGNVTLRVRDTYGRSSEIASPISVTVDGDLFEDGDNCPLDYNPDQTDTDRDGIGDACDPTPKAVSSVSENALVADELPTYDLSDYLVNNADPAQPILYALPKNAPVADELPTFDLGAYLSKHVAPAERFTYAVPQSAPVADELPTYDIAALAANTADSGQPTVKTPLASTGSSALTWGAIGLLSGVCVIALRARKRP